MNLTEEEKVRRFMSDPVMSGAVRKVILDIFLKPRAKLEVTTLAAERIAIDLFQDAWRELERFKTEKSASSTPETNLGV